MLDARAVPEEPAASRRASRARASAEPKVVPEAAGREHTSSAAGASRSRNPSRSDNSNRSDNSSNSEATALALTTYNDDLRGGVK